MLLGSPQRHSPGSPGGVSVPIDLFRQLVAHSDHSSDSTSGVIRFYDGRGDGTAIDTVDTLHKFPVHLMAVRGLIPSGVL